MERRIARLDRRGFLGLGFLCLVLLAICGVLARTIGPGWLWGVGPFFIGAGAAFLQAARQSDRRS